MNLVKQFSSLQTIEEMAILYNIYLSAYNQMWKFGNPNDIKENWKKGYCCSDGLPAAYINDKNTLMLCLKILADQQPEFKETDINFQLLGVENDKFYYRMSKSFFNKAKIQGAKKSLFNAKRAAVISDFCKRKFPREFVLLYIYLSTRLSKIVNINIYLLEEFGCNGDDFKGSCLDDNIATVVNFVKKYYFLESHNVKLDETGRLRYIILKLTDNSDAKEMFGNVLIANEL